MWDRGVVLGAVLVVVLWSVGEAVDGEPALPVQARCPAVFVHPPAVGESAP